MYILVALALIVGGGLMVDKCTFNQTQAVEISNAYGR